VKITHVLEDFSREGGGLPVMVAGQMQWQIAAGWDVALIQTAAHHLPIPDGVALYTCLPSRWGRAWRWSRDLHALIRNVLSERGGIVHIHGVWTAPQYLAAGYAGKMHMPCIVSPHGQLMPALASSAGGETSLWKKRLYRALIANDLLRHASVLHAITNVEADVIRITCPKNRIEVIPHGIDIKLLDREISSIPATKQADNRRTILFLGRLDYRKGIELLIRAFSQARLPGFWQLVIAGPDDHPGYRQRISKLIQGMDCRSRIAFLDPVFGQEKWLQYLDADLFCLPSSSEVMGLVNLEAALCGLPVLTTPQAGLEGWQEAGGLLIAPNLDAWVAALRQATGWSEEERQRRGARLRDWVCQRYNTGRMQRLWTDMYSSLS